MTNYIGLSCILWPTVQWLDLWDTKTGFFVPAGPNYGPLDTGQKSIQKKEAQRGCVSFSGVSGGLLDRDVARSGNLLLRGLLGQDDAEHTVGYVGLDGLDVDVLRQGECRVIRSVGELAAQITSSSSLSTRIEKSSLVMPGAAISISNALSVSLMLTAGEANCFAGITAKSSNRSPKMLGIQA